MPTEHGTFTAYGYRATVDPERVGLDVMAFVRLRYPTGNYRPFHALLDSTPEIIDTATAIGMRGSAR